MIEFLNVKEEIAEVSTECAGCVRIIEIDETRYKMFYKGGALWFCPACYAKELPQLKVRTRQQCYRDAIRIKQLAYEMISKSRASVGKAMAEYREMNGLTQSDLAGLLGCNYTYISKIENGHEEPGIALIQKMQALDTD